MHSNDIRIVLANRNTMIREGLHALLDRESGFRVVAEGEGGVDAVSLAQEHKPDIVVLDLTNSNIDGVETTRHILKHVPSTRVIGLAMRSDRYALTDAVRVGMSGYVLMLDPFEELSAAIRAVHAGRSYFSPRIADALAQVVRQRTSGATVQYVALTTRERQILQLLAAGKRTRDIAAVLFISPKTVETHRKNIMDKLDLRSIAELTKYAIQEGIISLD